MPDAISALDLEPSFDLKFTDGALNGLDALAGRVGNRLIGRPRLLGVAVQMRGDDVERHRPRVVAQILVAAQLLKPLQLHVPKWSRAAHARLPGRNTSGKEGPKTAGKGGTAALLSH